MPDWRYTAWYRPTLPEVGNVYLLDCVTGREGFLEGTVGRPIRVEGFLARLKVDTMALYVQYGPNVIRRYVPADVNSLTAWIPLGLELRDYRTLRMYMNCAPACMMWARVTIKYHEVKYE